MSRKSEPQDGHARETQPLIGASSDAAGATQSAQSPADSTRANQQPAAAESKIDWLDQLCFAARGQKFNQVTELLAKISPSQIDAEKRDGCRRIAAAVYHAAVWSEQALVKLVASFGAQCLVIGNRDDGNTALHRVVEFREPETVVSLVDKAVEFDGKCLKMRNYNGDTCFHYAARNRHGAIINIFANFKQFRKFLLSKNNSNQTPLHVACEKLSSEIVLKVAEVALKVDENFAEMMQDIDGDSCMHYAARNDSGDVIINLASMAQNFCRCLLAQNNSNLTPLHIACCKFDSDVVLQLAEMALKIDENCMEKTKDINGDACVHYAARNSDGSGIIGLVTKHERISKCLLMQNNRNQSPLHIACHYLDSEIVLSLASLACKIDENFLELRNNNGNTCVHYAALNGSKKVIMALANEFQRVGKCLLMQNKSNQTPLHIVCEQFGSDVVLKLAELALKIDENSLERIQDIDGDTCIHYAARNADPDVLLNLTNASENGGRCLLIQNNSNVTPLHIVCERRNPDVVLKLVEIALKIDRNCLALVKDINGDSCFHYAVKNRRNGDLIIKLMNEFGFDGKCLLLQNNGYQTPLHIACEQRNADIVAQLADMALKCNEYCLERMQDIDGDTCIHAAAWNRNGKVIVDLVTRAAENGGRCLLLPNKSDQTPLQVACEKLDSDTVLKLSEIALQIDNGFLDRLQDIEGDTCFHYAAKNSDAELMVGLASKSEHGGRCLLIPNNSNVTPLHMSCERFNSEAASMLADMALRVDEHCLERMQDIDGDTCMHYAASNSDGEVVMNLIALSKSDEQYLLIQNNGSQTPLHIAFENQSAKCALNLLDHAASKYPECRLSADPNGNIYLHYFSRNTLASVSDWGDILKAFEKSRMSRRNKKSQTPLQICFAYQKFNSLRFILDQVQLVSMKSADEEGNTCVHFAARGSFENFRLAVELAGVESLNWLNKGRETPVQVALQSASACGTSLFHRTNQICLFVERHKRELFLRQANLSKNTLLHSLFKSINWRSDKESNYSSHMYQQEFNLLDSYINFLKLLTARGVDVRMENNLHENFLHSSKVPLQILRDILARGASDAELGTILKQALYTSQGFHAVHTFSKWYQVRYLLEPLADLSGMSPDDLIRLAVSKGPYAGATCLHFACEAGHRDNIRFLLSKGLVLANETYAGRSCIDCGFDKGRLDDISDAAKAAKVSEISLLRMIDPPKRGLKLPDLATARKTLALIADASTIAEDEQDRSRRRPDGNQAGGRSESQGGAQRRVYKESSATDADMNILYKAFEQDSRSILRCAIRLDLLNPSVERTFPWFFAKRDRREKSRRRLAVTLPDDRKAHRPHGSHAPAADCFTRLRDFGKPVIASCNAEELSLLEIAVSRDNLDILPDLLTIRQFDLIPSAVNVIIQLNSKVAEGKGKSEQLSNLRQRIVAIAARSFNDLFLNGSDEDKELLFKFIKGTISTEVADPATAIVKVTTANELLSPAVAFATRVPSRSDFQSIPRSHTALEMSEAPKRTLSVSGPGQSPFVISQSQTDPLQSQPAPSQLQSGPKFPSRSPCHGKMKYHALIDLIDEADCDELYATECLYQMTCKDWSTPEPDSVLSRLGFNSFLSDRLSARSKFFIYATGFVAFLCFFAYHIIFLCLPPASGEHSGVWVEQNNEMLRLWFMILYALSFTMQEWDDVYRRRRKTTIIIGRKSYRLPEYLKDVLNCFDVLAILLMWVGIGLNFVAIYSSRCTFCYPSQMVLSTSFLLWGFRSAALLYYSDKIGPVISILGSLLMKDLMPFLLLIFVIFYSFGVFFLNLLFPVTNTHPDKISTSALVSQIFILPLYMMFGNTNKFEFSEADANSTSPSARYIEVGRRANPTGHRWFYHGLIFIFLILVNTVMVNLLIALFSLTVSRKAEKAQVIWRRKYFDMLQEYRHTSFVPPPFSIVYYVLKFIMHFAYRRKRTSGSDKPKKCTILSWWSGDGPDVPEEYMKFLRFQALRLRVSRPELLQNPSGELEELMGDSETAMERHGEMLDAMQEKLEDGIHGLKAETQHQLLSLQAELRSYTEHLQRRQEEQGEQMRSLQQLLTMVLENQGKHLDD